VPNASGKDGRSFLSNARIPDDLIEVGRIVGTHGLAGQLRLRLFNPASKLWTSDEELYVVPPIAQTGTWVRLQNIRINDSNGVASFREIKGLAMAKSLKGASLHSRRQWLRDASPGQIFLTDLIGLRLTDATGNEIGSLGEIRQAGGHEFFVVQGRADILLPAQTEFASVDLVNGVATLGFSLGPESLT
jgi:16S rRNA processing protein RimM